MGEYSHSSYLPAGVFARFYICSLSANVPRKAVKRFKTLTLSKGTQDDPTIIQALQNIRNSFSSSTRYGCFSVSRFIGSDGLIRNDAYQRVTMFLDNLDTEPENDP